MTEKLFKQIYFIYFLTLARSDNWLIVDVTFDWPWTIGQSLLLDPENNGHFLESSH